MVGQVAAGAISGKKTAAEVSFDRKRKGIETHVVEELHGVKSVLVGTRVPVLGREAIVDGDDDGTEVTCEAPAEVIVGLGVGGEKHEAAAVIVNDDGQGEIIRNGGGDEEAEPEVAIGVENDVVGGNAVAGFGGRRGFGVEEAHQAAVDGNVGAAADV